MENKELAHRYCVEIEWLEDLKKNFIKNFDFIKAAKLDKDIKRLKTKKDKLTRQIDLFEVI